MATWTVPAAVLAVLGAGDVLQLRVNLGGGVLTDAQVRLAADGPPVEPLRVTPGARRFVEQAVPPASRVWFVSDRRDRWGRPLGRLFYGTGRRRDLAAVLLEAGLAVPAHHPPPR